jgi:integrase
MEPLPSHLRQLGCPCGSLDRARAWRGDRHQKRLNAYMEANSKDVAVRGGAKNTLRAYRVVLTALARDCGWRTLSDLTAESFESWRAKRTGSAKYSNDCFGYVRTFISWLRKKSRLLADPLVDVAKIKIRTSASHRCALTTDEIKRLLDSVPERRSTIYLVAVYTGLRRNDLNGLRWLDFELDRTVPVVRVHSSISKNVKASVLPLRGEVVEALRRFKPEQAQPADRAFFGKVPNIDTFKRDLARVGIANRDEAGRKVDFHALRTTFGTHLAASGVAPRVAMEMMRRSDLKLTTKVYTDSAHLPVSEDLLRLPSLSVTKQTTPGDALPPVMSGHSEAHKDTKL